MKKILVMLLVVFIVVGCGSSEEVNEPKAKTAEEIVNEILTTDDVLKVSGFVSDIEKSEDRYGPAYELYYNGTLTDSNVDVTTFVGDSSREKVTEAEYTFKTDEFNLKNTKPFDELKQSVSNCSDVEDGYYTCTRKYINSYDDFNSIVIVEAKINSKSLEGEIVTMHTKKYTYYNNSKKELATLDETQEIFDLGIYDDVEKLGQHGYSIRFNEEELLVISDSEKNNVENTSAENIVKNAIEEVRGGNAEFGGRLVHTTMGSDGGGADDTVVWLENGVSVMRRDYERMGFDDVLYRGVVMDVKHIKRNYDATNPPSVLQFVEFIDPTMCENNIEESILTCNVKKHVGYPGLEYNRGKDEFKEETKYLVLYGDVEISYDKDDIKSISYDTIMLYDYRHYGDEGYDTVKGFEDEMYEILGNTDLIDRSTGNGDNDVVGAKYPYSLHFSIMQTRGVLTFK